MRNLNSDLLEKWYVLESGEYEMECGRSARTACLILHVMDQEPNSLSHLFITTDRSLTLDQMLMVSYVCKIRYHKNLPYCLLELSMSIKTYLFIF